MEARHRLLVGVAVFSVLLGCAVGQTHQPICAGPGSFDVSTLTMVKYWTVTSNGQGQCPAGAASCSFNISFCKPLPDHTDCLGSSVCVSYDNGTSLQSLSLGRYEHDPFILTTQGFDATFNDGSTSGPCNFSSTIIFECDPNAVWNPSPSGDMSEAPEPVSFAFNFATCQYKMVFGYAGACAATPTPYTGPTHQSICSGPGHYDVTNLTTVKYWTVTADGQCPAGAASCNFNISFCKPLPNHDDCQGSAVCVSYYNTTTLQSLSLGLYEHDPFALRDQGFEAIFGDGSTYGRCNMSSVIIFECDKSVPWIPSPNGDVSQAPQPKSIAFNFVYCQYNIVFAYAGACFTPVITPAPLGTGLSAGSVLVILFFTLVPAYFLIGIIYNSTQGRNGKDIVPQNEFWLALPTYVAEGFIFCITCGRGAGGATSSASGKEYENI